MNDNWIEAEPCASGFRLRSSQVSQWQESGFTFVSGLVPDDLIIKLQQAATSIYPAPGSDKARQIAHFGSDGRLTFPSQVECLNQVTLHESLLEAVAQLLETLPSDLRLTQSDLWPKYGRDTRLGIQDNSDQRIHIDYPNHTLAHPTPWHRPEAVEMILYLSDVQETGGATAVVPRQGEEDPAYRWPIVDSPGIGDLRYINDRSAAEEYFSESRPELSTWRQSLYQREKYARFKPGDLLMYRHDTWHRGTPMRTSSLRLVQNITYRKSASEWISTLHTGWAWQAYRDNKFLERLIACSSLNQRAVMGFPQPGSSYWCEQTIKAVEARYGVFGMDMTAYRQALR